MIYKKKRIKIVNYVIYIHISNYCARLKYQHYSINKKYRPLVNI
jgi:hypothetical protein